ncbi:MAG TPA: hypothetical protein VIF62_02780 [Labilithrix sp.]|jgi:hypothetical protein
MRTLTTLFVLGLVACGGATSDPSADTESDVKKAEALTPIALQYVGTYEWKAGTPGGAIQTLEIHRDGTYRAHWAMDDEGIDETGTVRASAGAKYPIVLHLTDSAKKKPVDPLTATISDPGTNKIHLKLPVEKTDFDLVATASVGPNESICDDSHGSWTDDDADPATGLYCICPKKRVYIPSAGGCVK